MGLSPIWKQQYNILKTLKQKINVLALGYVIFQFTNPSRPTTTLLA